MELERMQALGFCFSMVPAIRRLSLRTTKLVNKLFAVTWSSLTPAVRGCADSRRNPGAGRTACNGAEIDDGAINGIKVGLMGHWLV